MIEQRDPVELALERISAIEWRLRPSRGNANKAVMLEYYRRVALWSKALRLKHFRLLMFVDISHVINPAIQLNKAQIDVLEPIERKFSFHARWFCELYIRWTLIEQTPEVVRYGLPAPYEPVIRLFERGAFFKLDKTSQLSFMPGPVVWLPGRKRSWDALCARTPLLDFDDQTLDRLDRDNVFFGEPWPPPLSTWEKWRYELHWRFRNWYVRRRYRS